MGSLKAQLVSSRQPISGKDRFFMTRHLSGDFTCSAAIIIHGIGIGLASSGGTIVDPSNLSQVRRGPVQVTRPRASDFAATQPHL